MGRRGDEPASESSVVSADAPAWRPVLPFTKAMLLLGAFLVFLAGLQLFVFTTRTEHLFAWTIAVPATAAFLGAFYWSAIPLALLSGFQRVWAFARVGVPGVAVFLWATLATTLLHLGKFHFHDTDRVAKGAAWLWLAIYAGDPPLLTIALIVQLARKGEDPPRTSPIPGWFRAVLLLDAMVIVAIGVALFAAPTWTGSWWPWALTPLTARAMGSWLMGLGIVAAAGFVENDLHRVRVAFASYIALAVLQFIGLARFSGSLRDGISTWLYSAALVVSFAIGAYGLLAGQAASRSTVPVG